MIYEYAELKGIIKVGDTVRAVPGKSNEWIEEGLRALTEIKGRIYEVTHGICLNHKAEALRQVTDLYNPLQKWDDAKIRLDEENAKKILPFISHYEQERDRVTE